MAGWTHQKRLAIEDAFYAYLAQCFVNSKDDGWISLGDHLYDGQRYVITQIFDALEHDKHKIYILKSRQLGISTIIRALTIFLLGVHKGLKGAIVFDTSENKSEARAELEVMINDLPKNLKFPAIKSTNRAGLSLANDSKVLFMSAGVRKSKTSGTLGRSVGLTIAHCSELCSWDNDEGLEAFEQSLSENNPDRLYIYESTARGFNRWWELWHEARKDPHHCVCIFLGWWSKDSQRIDKSDPDFLRYGEQAPSEKELEKIAAVKNKYGVDITPEQLAWVRRKYDPSASQEGDANPEYEANTTRIQEQPWTEDEAFQQTGAVFFAPEKLTEMTNKNVSMKYTTWMYGTGIEFTDMKVYKAANARSIELKVWEEPDPEGVYVIGVDPAYGENEDNCRSAIEVIRCYADGCDQVAEYAWPLVNTRQLGWVVASLLGWYGAGHAEARYILELNGPGGAVFNEMRSLRHQIETTSYNDQQIQEKGLKDVFRNVKTYIYTRNDSMGAGNNYHFKTTVSLKVMILERLRDFVSNGMLRVRSMDLVDEMKTIAREGDSIKAPGSMKDDRTIAMALAIHCWEEKVRKSLITQKRTREAEAARKRLSITDQVYLFQQNQLSAFFNRQASNRLREQALARRMAWRGR